jgi:hypothetical protein
MRKQMEGDQTQRRKKARVARDHGRTASEEASSTGASKQREHRSRNERTPRKLPDVRRGKQPSVRQGIAHPNPGAGRPTNERTPKKNPSRKARPSARKRSG